MSARAVRSREAWLESRDMLVAAGITVMSAGPIPEGTISNRNNSLPPRPARGSPASYLRSPRSTALQMGLVAQSLLSLLCGHLSPGPGPSQLRSFPWAPVMIPEAPFLPLSSVGCSTITTVVSLQVVAGLRRSQESGPSPWGHSTLWRP